jgi:hypothetical protein
MDFKQEALDDIYAHFDEFHKNTVWQEECQSWFKDGKVKNRIYLWTGPVSLVSSCCPRNTYMFDVNYTLSEDYQGFADGRLQHQIQVQEQVCISEIQGFEVTDDG